MFDCFLSLFVSFILHTPREATFAFFVVLTVKFIPRNSFFKHTIREISFPHGVLRYEIREFSLRQIILFLQSCHFKRNVDKFAYRSCKKFVECFALWTTPTLWTFEQQFSYCGNLGNVKKNYSVYIKRKSQIENPK